MGDYVPWYRSVDKMVLISPYHKLDHQMRRYIDDEKKIVISDLGILSSEYETLDVNSKVPYRVVYCSQPDRGLNYLADYWDEILARVPELQLNIFGGFSLWNGWNDLDSQFRLKWVGKRNVTYQGKVDRNRLVEYQRTSEAMLYPCIFPELFNISTAECLAAGNYCVTSEAGAIDTTNFCAGKTPGLPTDVGFKEHFINKIAEYFLKPIEERKEIQVENHRLALARFDWKVIVDFWEKEILHG
jgi:glycosyltransferase involved in cell wall biosynthesis